MPYAERPGARIHYLASGAGPALVLAHGAGGNRLSWWQQLPYFERHYRVVRIDHRGFGRSLCEPEAFHPRHFAGDLRAILDAEGIDRAAVVGQSMGGWTALRTALEHPDRISCLVLCGTPAGVLTEPVVEAAMDLAGRVREEGVRGNAALAPDFPEREPALARLYDEINALNDVPDPSMLARLFEPEATLAPERLSELAQPTLFVAGEQDQLFPPGALRSVAARIDGAEFELMQGSGHSTYFEDAKNFNRIVGDFLARQG